MKKLILGLITGASMSVFASPVEYNCTAKENPNRGIETQMELLASPVKAGGTIFATQLGKKVSLGIISDVLAVTRSSDTQEFDMVLGYFGEKDVSGVSQSDLKKITSIVSINGSTKDGDEVKLLKYFKGKKQIGGTLFYAGLASSCLPVK